MTNEKPLTIKQLSVYSLREKPFRTISLVVVVFILAFTLFGGAILSASLQNGLNSLKERLGADIAVVPLGYESQYEGIILSGEPVRFYLSKSVEQQVAQVDGVKKVSTQFYLSTLVADCCSAPVQIIGIDPDTDFVTKSWISKGDNNELKDGQMIVGSNVWPDRNKKLIFFNHEFFVVAKLEKTSTGMDNSVFVNLKTARELAQIAKEMGIDTNVDIQNVDVYDVVSSVLIKIEEGYSPDEVADNIHRLVNGISLVKSKNIFFSVSGNLDIIQSFVGVFSVILWILATLILTVLFSVTINSRKKEYSVLRILGVTKKRLIKAVFIESMMTSVTGSFAGVLLATIMFFLFSNYVGHQIGLPFLIPGTNSIIIYLGIALMLSAITGPVSAIYAALTISRKDTYITLREGE